MNPNTQQTTGEHLLLIRGTDWNSGLSPTALKCIMTDFYSWVDGLQNQGILRGAQPLMEEGRLVTGPQGVVTDGVFAESKDEAVRLPHACPILAHGAQMEVRPIDDLCRPMADVKAFQG